VAGKPEQPMADLVRARYGNRGVVVGDRPSTDGAFAATLGWPFALVLSGVAGSPGGEQVPDPAPPFVAADLARLVPMLGSAGPGRREIRRPGRSTSFRTALEGRRSEPHQ